MCSKPYCFIASLLVLSSHNTISKFEPATHYILVNKSPYNFNNSLYSRIKHDDDALLCHQNIILHAPIIIIFNMLMYAGTSNRIVRHTCVSSYWDLLIVRGIDWPNLTGVVIGGRSCHDTYS